MHVPKEKRSKFDPSGKKGIFVGYSETSKAYRVYILGHQQFEISRVVTVIAQFVARSKRLKDKDQTGETGTFPT
jgi:hypothetical protein